MRLASTYMGSEEAVKSEHNYTSIAQLSVDSQISISDTSYFYDEAVIIEVPSGRYQVEVAYDFPEGHKHVAAMRVAPEKSTDLCRGPKLGSLIVDFGQVGICDRDAVEAAFEILGDEQMNKYYDQLDSTELTLIVRLPGQTEMIVVRPGFGDGSYPVYGIVDRSGTQVGFEIQCI